MTDAPLARRVATAAAVVGALAVAVGARSWVLATALLAALAAVGGLDAAADGAPLRAAAGHALAALAVVVGLAGPVAAVGALGAPWWVAGVAVALWIGTALAADGRGAVWRSTGVLVWTTALSALGTGLAWLVWSGVLPVPTGAARTVATWPAGGAHLGVSALLAAALAVVGAVALATLPAALVLSPRPSDRALRRYERVQDLADRSSYRAMQVAVVAVVLIPTGVLAVEGPVAAAVDAAFRWLVLAGVALAALAVVVGKVVGFVWNLEQQDPGRAPAILGGAAVVTAVAVLVAAAVPALGASPTGLLSGVALGCFAAALGLVLVRGALSAAPGRDRRASAVAGAFLAAGLALALRTEAVLGPILAVAAGLVAWDALSYESSLREELAGAPTAAVERTHFGGTLAVGALTAVGAGVVATVVRVGGPAIEGRPLPVVVTAGVVALAAVGALAYRG